MDLEHSRVSTESRHTHQPSILSGEHRVGLWSGGGVGWSGGGGTAWEGPPHLDGPNGRVPQLQHALCVILQLVYTVLLRQQLVLLEVLGVS